MDSKYLVINIKDCEKENYKNDDQIFSMRSLNEDDSKWKGKTNDRMVLIREDYILKTKRRNLLLIQIIVVS